MIKLLRPKFILSYITLCIFLLFLNNHVLSFWDQDEAAYAGFAYRMNKTGNYIIPEFTWSEPHRKPPLHFWMIAASFKIFGPSEFATRVPSALAMLLSVVSVYYFSRKSLGRDIAAGAALVLGSSFIPSLGKVSVTDASLLLFETVAMLSLWNYLIDGKIKHLLWIWLSVSLGVLLKGPPILIVFLGTSGLVFLFTKQKLRSFIAAILALTGIIPLFIWGRIAWLSDGGQFITWMIDWYILKRTSGTVFGQTGPPGYYLAVFLVAFLPWLAFLPKALFDSIRNVFYQEKRTQFDLFAFFWIICGWLFYEALPSKLPAYSIAVVPLLSILISRTVLSLKSDQALENPFIKYAWIFQSIICIGIAIAIIGALSPILNDNGKAVCLIIAVFCLTAPSLFYFSLKGKFGTHSLLAIPFFGFGFMLLVWGLLIPSFEVERSATLRVAEQLQISLKKGEEVIITRDFDLPSLPVYLEFRKISYRIVENPDEWTKLFSSNKPYTFILGNENISQFYKGLPENERPYIAQIKGWVSDQGKSVDYLLVKN